MKTFNGNSPEREGRIPLLGIEEMTTEQRRLYDSVVAGPRGQMIGPLRAAIHSPELANLWSPFGAYLRYNTCLTARASELAIIVTSRRWTCQVEWWVHAGEGAKAGLPQSAIDAIREAAPPKFESDADLEVYEFSRLLQQTGQVPVGIYQAVTQRWGTRGVVELTAVIGYYTMVAMTLNAHEIPVPEGTAPPLHSSAILPTLPPGQIDRLG
jgi:4-carboxymuconolactone decarboxylase